MRRDIGDRAPRDFHKPRRGDPTGIGNRAKIAASVNFPGTPRGFIEDCSRNNPSRRDNLHHPRGISREFEERRIGTPLCILFGAHAKARAEPCRRSSTLIRPSDWLKVRLIDGRAPARSRGCISRERCAARAWQRRWARVRNQRGRPELA